MIEGSSCEAYVKRGKNDAADAEAVCEAAQRPGMRFVPVKSEAQQASGVVFRARDLLVWQRTQCINALRGHLAEYGHAVPQGPAHVGALVALVEDPESSVPESARGILQVPIRTLEALEEQRPRPSLGSTAAAIPPSRPASRAAPRASAIQEAALRARAQAPARSVLDGASTALRSMRRDARHTESRWTGGRKSHHSRDVPPRRYELRFCSR